MIHVALFDIDSRQVAKRVAAAQARTVTVQVWDPARPGFRVVEVSAS